MPKDISLGFLLKLLRFCAIDGRAWKLGSVTDGDALPSFSACCQFGTRATSPREESRAK